MNRRTDPPELQEHCGARVSQEVAREMAEAFPEPELTPEEEEAMYTSWLLDLSDEEIQRLQLEAQRQEAERMQALSTASVIAMHNIRAIGKVAALFGR